MSCSWVPVGIEYIQLPLKNEKNPEALTCVEFTRYFAHPGEGWQTVILPSPGLCLRDASDSFLNRKTPSWIQRESGLSDLRGPMK